MNKPDVAGMLRLQTEILRDLSAGRSADFLAIKICHLAEHIFPGRIASIMVMRESGELGVFAAPSAPLPLAAALEGLAPGPGSGSCGAAIFHRTPIYVAETQSDPRWSDLALLAREFDIHSCWSYPIWQDERLIGTFALTGGTQIGGETTLPDAPTEAWLEHLAGIAGNVLQAARQQAAQERQHRRLQRLARFHAMLAGVNHLAAGRPEAGVFFEEICRVIITRGALPLAWIGVPDASGRFQTMAANGAVRYLDDLFVSIDPDIPEGQGPAGRAWRSGAPVVIKNFDIDSTYCPWRARAAHFKLGASAALPLKVKGQTRAVLSLYTRGEEDLDEEFASLLGELAFDLSLALEAIEQQHRLERLHGLYNALLAATDSLLVQRDEQAILKQACAHLATSGLFDAVWIARTDADNIARVEVAYGSGVPLLDGIAVPLAAEAAPLTVRTLRAGKLQVCNNYFEDEEFVPWHSFLAQRNWSSGAAMPIFRAGSLYAALVFVSRVVGCFDHEILALVEKIGQLLSHGLDELDLKTRLEQERRQQFHLARHDTLTGLPNRLQFEEHLQFALSRAKRQGGRVAVGLLDLDDFKPINDVWGHATGDALLCQFATRLRALLRQSDLLARFGGDEFVLAIEGLPEVESLTSLLDRLQAAVETPFSLGDGLTISTAFSLGIAVFPEDGDNPDLLLRRADAALYVAKARKGQRAQWWQRWHEDALSAREFRLSLPDPYGADAARVLSAYPTLDSLISEDFVAEFYRLLSEFQFGRNILEHVTEDDFTHLKKRQVQSLQVLLAAETTADVVAEQSRHLGRLYALSNIESALIAQGTGIFQTLFTQKLTTLSLRGEDRQTLPLIINARLQDMMAAAIAAHEKTIASYLTLLLPVSLHGGGLWVDAVQGHLDALATLPGIVGAELLRPDTNGVFEIEASGGAAKQGIQPVWRMDGRMAHLADRDPRGRGLLAIAWRTQEIQICDNYALDPRVAPWRDVMATVGITSAAVLPVQDMRGRPVFVMVLFGRYPRQFSSVWMRQFCVGVMQRLSLLWQQSEAAPREVIPEMVAERWRARVFSGGLQMHYQPIIDLETGQPREVEALARLVMDNGEMISPGQFLPALGKSDLDLLFRLGLSHALRQLAAWTREGASFGVSVNLPPTTLLRPECAVWVHDALIETGIPAARLSLEIMETGHLDRNEAATAATIAQVSALGVRVSMDDLGSGYSSLQRLRQLPFDAVKIDQSLVRDVRRDPIRVLGFIGALVQLGRDLGLDVVIEGLESEELIEAAAILGAKAGQGFALARPMPAAAIASWLKGATPVIDRYAPRTALGALAAHWRFAHGSAQAIGSAEGCPIGRFIAARGLAGSALDRLHRAQHEIGAQEGLRSQRHQELMAKVQESLIAMLSA